jgi:acetyl esterase/lipase
MDLYRPQAGKGRTAAILLLHGGGWVGGGRADMAELGEYIARNGNLAASADYRLAPKDRWPAQLEDVQTAVRYLRANADRLNIDPKRIASIGISAGGHLSLFLGAVDAPHPVEYPGFSSKVEAVGSISGLHDLRLKMTGAGEQYRIVEALTGSREGPAVEAASPILSLNAKSAPTYFIQGADDPLVPPDQTEHASKRLAELGVPEKAETVPGMGHGIALSDESQAAAFSRMMAWILKRLP